MLTKSEAELLFKQLLRMMSHYNAADSSYNQETEEREKVKRNLKKIASQLRELGGDPDQIVKEGCFLVDKSNYTDLTLRHKRVMRFEGLMKHPHYRGLIGKLTHPEMTIIRNFLEDHGLKPSEEYCKILNFLFLNKIKPKNWALIQELLHVSDTEVTK